MEIDQNFQAHTSNSMEPDQIEGVLAVVVEVVAEVAVSSATKQDKFPGAGQEYQEGKHRGKVLDDAFEDIGGFSVQKINGSLYKEIWLNYGHIASSQVLTDSYYYTQVAVVSELMNFIADMNHCPLEEVSSELIDCWEKKIKVAEKLEFSIGWLRERLEDIKKNFAEEKKIQDTLMEQVTKREIAIEAEQQLVLAKERLSALEAKISSLLKEKESFLSKCGGPLLLFNCSTNLSRLQLEF
ncbi:uncharacterized protein LOC113327799 [Papaver somniferum]|uniref:uncharacterized protein LOC113327799 n=1 Tax=Papaver somniferum TaxID=3469 RepID=UPI000E6FC18F|nr:uncharacterized protein LOC113327799 [Papaver somniferum]